MNNDTVISLLTNLGVVSALLASLLFGIVMTIPHKETMLGDKRFLSISSLAFRCQFADWSDPGMTLEICSPELTVLIKRAESHEPNGCQLQRRQRLVRSEVPNGALRSLRVP